MQSYVYVDIVTKDFHRGFICQRKRLKATQMSISRGLVNKCWSPHVAGPSAAAKKSEAALRTQKQHISGYIVTWEPRSG